MLKDLFTFSRNERKGIIVLLALMFIVLIAPTVYKSMSQPSKRDYSEFLKIIEELETLNLSKQNEDIDITHRRTSSNTAIKKLQPFDPNSISPDELINMGFSARLSNTINNFRKSGGIFSKKEDLKKIYGITDALYNEIEPYIIINQTSNEEKTQFQNMAGISHEEIHSKQKARKHFEPELININQADSVELTKLKGIGQAFSRRIIKYRELLGGFHSTEQLLEVFGIDTLRYNSIKENIITDNQIRKININTAEFDELYSHPYITKNVANSIVMMRKQHGKYKSVEEIKKSALIDENSYLKIYPYLKVNE